MKLKAKTLLPLLLIILFAGLALSCEKQEEKPADKPSDEKPKGDEESHEDGAFVVSGEIVGEAPEGSKVVAMWIVSSSSPDYEYKFGEAEIVDGKFSMSLTEALPEEALNSYGLGVAYVVLVNEDIPDGRVSKRPEMLGLSSNEAILFHKDKGKGLDWSSPFDAGYSCGACVYIDDQMDTYKPGSCEAIKVHTDLDGPICNWT